MWSYGEVADPSVWIASRETAQNFVGFAGGNRTRYIDARSGIITVIFLR